MSVDSVVFDGEGEGDLPEPVLVLHVHEGGNLGRMIISVETGTVDETRNSRTFDLAHSFALDPEDLVDALNLCAGRRAFAWIEPDE